ncbi:MAG TPA: penicillin-binding protein [Edaphocola sp.]|nr:penicillin-binding protein [Edaphocola sp.]
MATKKNISVKKDITRRVNISFTLIVLFAVAIIAKAATTQIKDGESLKAQANETFSKTQTIFADRGNIYTEEGRILSATIPRFNLKMDLSVVNVDTFKTYIDTLSLALSKIFGDESPRSIKNRMSAAFVNKAKYWTLKDNVWYYQFQEVRALPIFNKQKNKGGFLPETQMKRDNPYKRLGFRTIGIWREDGSSIGIENSYDTALAGRAGSRALHKITGYWIPVIGSEIDPVHGKDIVTTIDIDIQEVAEHALHEVMEKYEALQGTAIVMEVATGKIKALANLGRQKDGSYWEDFNYAMIPSEPGSVFKLMSLYALLEDGYVNIDSKVNCMGGLARFGNQTVRDDHKGLGLISVEDAFAQSSNVAFATLINKYYKDNPMKYIKHLQFLGLDKKTKLDLTGERSPLIKTTKSKSWNKVTSLPWIAYGYESMITPLHTCMFYNAVANDGKMMQPYLVSSIMEDGKVIEQKQPKVLIEKIGKESTIKQLQQVTRAVVQKGTAKAAQSPYYTAGGKTGTAQVVDKIGGVMYRYSDGVRQGSFVGYFPAEKPQYTIAVLIRSKPHGQYYGSVLGVPVFKAIADKLYTSKIGGWKVNVDSLGKVNTLVAKAAPAYSLAYLLDKMGRSYSSDNKYALLANATVNENGQPLRLQSAKVESNIVPNVMGMGMKEALNLLENSGLKVKVVGTGSVQSQSLPVGANFKIGQTINLVFQ